MNARPDNPAVLLRMHTMSSPAPSQITSLLTENRSFPPPPEFAAKAHIKTVAEYEKLWQRAKDDPEGFWSEQAESLQTDANALAALREQDAPDVAFDFRLPRVKSISTSGHKFGLAPLGVGWVIWRDREELPEDLVFHVNYLGGDMPVFQINFSRPAGQIIAQYYNFLRLGFDGYKRIHDASYAIGQYLAAEIVKVGPFELLCDSNPATGIPTVTWRIRDGADPGYTLFDLADRLRTRGWQVPAYTLTGTASDIAVQRILVRLGVSQDMASLLLDDFRNAVAHFARHPVTVPMSKEETGGFNHL